MFLPHFLEALCEPDLDRVLMGRSVYEHVWSNCEQSAWKGEEKECDRHNNIRQRSTFSHENYLCFYSDMYLNAKVRTVPADAGHEKSLQVYF